MIKLTPLASFKDVVVLTSHWDLLGQSHIELLWFKLKRATVQTGAEQDQTLLWQMYFKDGEPTTSACQLWNCHIQIHRIATVPKCIIHSLLRENL